MPIATLNCPMCGAAISSDSTQCAYCKAKLATVACPSCFGVAFVGSKFCPHCGAALATSAELPAGLNCPRCRVSMGKRDLKGTPMLECPRCTGIWISSATFDRICADREKQVAVLGGGLGDLFEPVQHVARAMVDPHPNYIPCPQCGQLMNRLNFMHRSGVIIDVCKPHGIWFDKDELRKIVEFIRSGGIDKARAVELERLQQAQRTSGSFSGSMTDGNYASEGRSSDHPQSAWVDLAMIIGMLGVAALKFLR